MENTSKSLEEIRFPSLITRIKCTLTDALVVIGLMIVATQILNSFENPPVWSRILALGIIVLYEPILVAYGRTVGQLVMGLQIVEFDGFSKNRERNRINIVFSIFRYLIKILLGWLSLLTVTRNIHRKAIHDTFSNSIMLEA